MEEESTLTYAIRPLTRINEKTRRPFEREPDVERQIIEAQGMPAEQLLARAELRDRHDERFLREECLVYLIREYNGDDKMRWLVNDLTHVLLTRIQGYLAGQLRTLGEAHFEEASDEVVEKLFSKVIDTSSDLGDFAQVNFWSFLAAKVSDAYRKHLTQLKKERSVVAPAWVHGMETADPDQPGEDKEPEPSSGPALDVDLLREELLSILTGRHLVTIKLYWAGWPIESKKPGEPTISRYFGKTPRTINNWLREAQQLLLAARQRDEL